MAAVGVDPDVMPPPLCVVRILLLFSAFVPVLGGVVVIRLDFNWLLGTG